MIDMNSMVEMDGITSFEIHDFIIFIINVFLKNITFVVTIFVVFCSALATLFINFKLINNQKVQASKSRKADYERKISEFRHNWLQEVRNVASELMKSIYDYQQYLMLTNLSRARKTQEIEGGNKDNAARIQIEVSAYYEKQHEFLSSFYLYSSKIKLLFKNGDIQTEKLFKLIDDFKRITDDSSHTSIDEEIINRIICELQIVLKKEWEVTKDYGRNLD